MKRMIVLYKHFTAIPLSTKKSRKNNPSKCQLWLYLSSKKHNFKKLNKIFQFYHFSFSQRKTEPISVQRWDRFTQKAQKKWNRFDSNKEAKLFTNQRRFGEIIQAYWYSKLKKHRSTWFWEHKAFGTALMCTSCVYIIYFLGLTFSL